MATTVRASSNNGAASGTALSVSAPTGTTTGDVALVFITHNSEAALSDNNGATPFTESLEYTPSFGGFGRLAIYSRRIQAGDPATYNFTSAATGRWSAIAVTLQNPHASTIFDVSPVGGDSAGASDTTGTSNSITTLTSGALHFIFFGVDGAANAITGTPAGYTAEQNVTTNQCGAVAYKVIASPSATGAQTWTWTNNSGWVGINMAVMDQDAVALKAGTLSLMGVGK